MSELTSISALIKIEFETSTHLGAGHGNVGVNRIVKRTADRKPYVPASALKGALRMAAERLMHLLAEDDSIAHLQRKGNAVPESSNASPCAGPDPKGMCQSRWPCLVCRVFGNGWTGLRLIVDDAKLNEEDALFRLKKLAFEKARAAYLDPAKKGLLDPESAEHDLYLMPDYKLDRFAGTDQETVTRAQIDRKRRGAAKGALFTSEYTLKQSFKTRLSGWLPLTPALDEEAPPLELILLAASIGFVDQIGGEASTGHGLCKLSIVNENGEEGTIKVNGEHPYTRAQFIDALDYLPFFT